MVVDNQAQSLAISEISAAVCNMDLATQQNAAMVEETSAAANGLSAKVQRMVQQASVFRWERRERSLPVAGDRRRTDRRGPDSAPRDAGGGERRARRLADA
jgi:methyl-accepting chemotaxis protein